MERSDGRTLSTVERAFEIVETLVDMGGGRITTVADRLDMAPSTVHGYLSTLERRRYVVKEGDHYYPALAFLRVAEFARTRRDEYRLAEEYTRKLGDRTGCRSLFAALEHGRAVLLHVHAGEHSEWDHEREGNSLHLHDTAVGKAILAALPDGEIEAVVDEWGLPASTGNTITDREALFDELEAIRERGVAFNRGENFEGLRAVGVAVESEGRVVGGFSVSGAAKVLTGDYLEEELPEQLLAVADEFELDASLAL
jgi:DNA-binding IclR family transcriptional regulator